MPKDQSKFRGVFTAIVTPFKDNGELDLDSLKDLVESQIKAGCAGIVPVGTTGESPTLTKEEKKTVITTCIKQAAGRCVIIAGTGSNNTTESADMTLWAQQAGADAALVVIPYYNKPNQEGLFRHFKSIADKAPGMPIVLYNIPGRCVIQLTPQTVARLYKEIPEVVAIKESTGSLDMASEIASLCDITILSGDDSLTLPIMSIGGTGVISVLSNWAPEKVLAIVKPALEGDFSSAAKAHLSTFNLMKTMFIQPNPQPVKAAMSMLGMCQDSLRLPMISCDEAARKQVADVMNENGYKVNPKKRGRND